MCQELGTGNVGLSFLLRESWFSEKERQEINNYNMMFIGVCTDHRMLYVE